MSVPRALLRLCIGHKSEKLDKPTSDGHTHHWTVFLRAVGTNQFKDHSFIKKVIFQLHPDFPNPRRVIRDPPFEVTETGYGGFSIPITVSFVGTSKSYSMHYDMNLSLEKFGHHSVEQILEFKQPTQAFYGLIMKYGGVVKKSDRKKEKRVYQHDLAQVKEASVPNLETPSNVVMETTRDLEKRSTLLDHESMVSKQQNEKVISSERKKLKEKIQLDELLRLQRELMNISDAEKITIVAETLLDSQNSSVRISEDYLVFDLCSLSSKLVSKLSNICASQS